MKALLRGQAASPALIIRVIRVIVRRSPVRLIDSTRRSALNAAAGEAVSVVGLLAVLAWAVVRPGADLPFCVFVLGLGIVVKAVVDNGLGAALAPLVPAGTSLPALLAIAALAAVLANICNNLPTVLVLLPLVASSGAGAVLALLLGVNIGPNLTYTGSLATLLWRRVLHRHGTAPDLGEFTRLGLLTVPAGLLVAVLGLWAGLRVIGG
jgi:arsenical pump membrane protein